MMNKIRGIVPAMATPLTEGGRPDEAGIRRLVQHLLAGGVSGLFACGSTGEGPMLRDEDWATVIDWVVAETAGRVPVLACIADAGTQRVIDRAHRAAELGAQAVVSTLPYYYVHQGDEARRFFTAVADASELPLYVYNVPQRTQVALSPDLLAELSEHENIAGVKDSSADVIAHFSLIHRLQGHPRFSVLNGSEFFLGASVMMGGDGGLLGIANLAPRLCVQLYEAALRGDIAAVKELQPRVSEVTTIFFTPGGSPICAIKRALEMLGICGATASSPFIPTPPAQDDHIRTILERNGVK